MECGRGLRYWFICSTLLILCISHLQMSSDHQGKSLFEEGWSETFASSGPRCNFGGTPLKWQATEYTDCQIKPVLTVK